MLKSRATSGSAFFSLREPVHAQIVRTFSIPASVPPVALPERLRPVPPQHDPLNINVVGIEPLPSQELEVRFAVKLRVQKPQ